MQFRNLNKKVGIYICIFLCFIFVGIFSFKVVADPDDSINYVNGNNAVPSYSGTMKLNENFNLQLSKTTISNDVKLNENFIINYSVDQFVTPDELLVNYTFNSDIILVVEDDKDYFYDHGNDIISCFDNIVNTTNRVRVIPVTSTQAAASAISYDDFKKYMKSNMIYYKGNDKFSFPFGTGIENAYKILYPSNNSNNESNYSKKVIILIGDAKDMKSADNEETKIFNVGRLISENPKKDGIIHLIDLDENSGQGHTFDGIFGNLSKEFLFTSKLNGKKEVLSEVIKYGLDLPNIVTLDGVSLYKSVISDMIIDFPNIKFNNNKLSTNQNSLPLTTLEKIVYTLDSVSGTYKQYNPYVYSIPMKITKIGTYNLNSSYLKILNYKFDSLDKITWNKNIIFPELSIKVIDPYSLINAGLYLPNNPSIITSKKQGDIYTVSIAKGIEYQLGVLLKSLSSNQPTITFTSSDLKVNILPGQNISSVSYGNANKLVVQKISCNILGEYLIDINSNGIKLGTIKLKVVDMPNVE